ncbi:MAG: hypothetical protein ACD_15C00026G0009 [uncultured bacterium]|nr:MAG: hypothetical protein ACD_15C00026G0009 [uncultured bacterium]
MNLRTVQNTNSSKWKKIIIAAILLAVVVFFVRFWISKKDVSTEADKKSAISDKNENNVNNQRVAEGINIRVSSPSVNEIVVSPMKISGEAKGWYFESSFIVKLLDDKGTVLAQGWAKSKGDGSKDVYMPFEAELEFDPKDSKNGNLVFEKSNPSGKPENAGSFSFAVLFEK